MNFKDWHRCLEGNVYLISLIALSLLSAGFIGIGVFKIRKNKKNS